MHQVLVFILGLLMSMSAFGREVSTEDADFAKFIASGVKPYSCSQNSSCSGHRGVSRVLKDMKKNDPLCHKDAACRVLRSRARAAMESNTTAIALAKRTCLWDKRQAYIRSARDHLNDPLARVNISSRSNVAFQRSCSKQFALDATAAREYLFANSSVYALTQLRVEEAVRPIVAVDDEPPQASQRLSMGPQSPYDTEPADEIRPQPAPGGI